MSEIHTTIVFDDEEEIADEISSIAKQFGHTAVAVTNEHAFVRAYSSSAKLIVLDLSMPDFDGIEAIDFLARTEYRGDLILMSGSAFRFLEIARKLATSKGLRVIGLLEKPFSVAQIMGTLEFSSGDRRQMDLPLRGKPHGASPNKDE